MVVDPGGGGRWWVVVGYLNLWRVLIDGGGTGGWIDGAQIVYRCGQFWRVVLAVDGACWWV